MVTPAQALAKYGAPELEKFMTLWVVPLELEIGAIPKKLYCNKDMVLPLSNAFKALIDTGTVSELKTFDGCFNIRKQRGAKVNSLHSFGIAIDVNAAWNKMYTEGNLSAEFVKCFTDNGFDWGGNFHTRLDPMHFQLSSIN